MTYLHSKISEVDDADFQQLINEVYHCVDWCRDDSQFTTLWYLLSAINVQDGQALTTKHLPTRGVLSLMVDRLSVGVIYELCKEVANLKRTHIESFDGKTVLSLLKISPAKSTRQRKTSRNQLRHETTTCIITQRRANGDL